MKRGKCYDVEMKYFSNQFKSKFSSKFSISTNEIKTGIFQLIIIILNDLHTYEMNIRWIPKSTSNVMYMSLLIREYPQIVLPANIQW